MRNRLTAINPMTLLFIVPAVLIVGALIAVGLQLVGVFGSSDAPTRGAATHTPEPEYRREHRRRHAFADSHRQFDPRPGCRHRYP